MTKRWNVAALAGALAVSSTVFLAAPSRAQATVPAGLAVLRASAAPAVPPRSVALGPPSPSTKLHLDVTLKLPDPAAVTAFISSLSDRRSPNFRRFLAPGQFGQRFGPPLSEVAAVEAVLRSDGLDPGPVTSNHLMIPVTAPAGLVDRAFHVELLGYRLASGRKVFTTSSPPSIAAGVSADVQGIVGLNNLVQAHSMLAHSSAAPVAPGHVAESRQAKTAGPKPCSDAIKAAESTSGSRTADVLASYYGMTPLYDLGDFGQGVHIAVAEFEPNLPSDIAGYQSCYGTNAPVNYIEIDGGPGTGPGGGEAVLDIEDVLGFAPEATVDVYQGANNPSGTNLLDVYSAIVTRESDQIISTGWGMCEPDTVAQSGGGVLLSAEQALFAQAAAQGQTVFAASGDTGSADCYLDPGTTNGAAATVDDPASQPYVIGVGGTSIGANSETSWNDASGAGGGGVSSQWCMPSYQAQSSTPGKSTIPGLVNADSVPAPAALQGPGCPPGSYMREVPDVSADADPATGYVIYRTPNTPGAQAVWTPGEGGTSASAPLWAAIAALVDASPFCTGYNSVDVAPKGTLPEDATGLLDENLYYLANTPYYTLALYDVTKGSNYFAPAGDTVNTGRLYPATTGYDMASGLGTPTVGYPGNFLPGLAALTCAVTGTKLTKTKIAHVVPDLGPSTRSTKVTIFGSGFLPIVGSDMVKVGTKWVTVSCLTNTRCTGTLPATKAGTESLRMVVEDITASPSTPSDQFTFAGVPNITRLRPLAGPEKSGTKVTIRGTGYLGKVKVFFGTRRATHVHVISPSKITVWAPSGTGSVSVYVSTIGGKSKKTPVGKFRYTPPPKKKSPPKKRK
jgi:subtilase family serine protease